MLKEIRENYEAGLSYKVEHYDLEFYLDKNETEVINRFSADFLDGDLVPLILNGSSDQTIKTLKINGEERKPADFLSSDGNTLTIPKSYIRSKKIDIEVSSIISPKQNKDALGLYLSEGDKGLYCTQLERSGFRKITWGLDDPRNASTFHTVINVDTFEAPMVLASGNYMDYAPPKKGSTICSWTYDLPIKIPSYLYALVAGDIISIEEDVSFGEGDEKRNISIRVWGDETETQDLSRALDIFVKALKYNHDKGLTYPLSELNAIALKKFEAGAMENLGIIVFNSEYLANNPKYTTDINADFTEACIHHELAHTWFGNDTRIHNWFYLFMKESFATLYEQKMKEELSPESTKVIERARVLQELQFEKHDSKTKAHPLLLNALDSFDNIYDVTTYEYGAEVLRMICTLMPTKEKEKNLLIDFHKANKGMPIKLDDFLSFAAEYAGKKPGKVIAQMTPWFTTVGTTDLLMKEYWDKDRGRYEITFSQRTKDAKGRAQSPRPIPIRMQLLGQNMKPLAPSFIHVMMDKEETLTMTMPADKNGYRHKPIPEVLMGLSAPVRYTDRLAIADLLKLFKYGKDPYIRYRSIQSVAQVYILETLKQKDARVPVNFFDDFVMAKQAGIEDRLLAEAMGCVDFKSLMAAAFQYYQTSIDPKDIYRAIKLYYAQMAEALEEHFPDWLEYCDTATEALTSENIGKRALKAVILEAYAAKDAGDQAFLAEMDRRMERAISIGQVTEAENILRSARHCPDFQKFQSWYDQMHTNFPQPNIACLARYEGISAAKLIELLRSASIQAPEGKGRVNMEIPNEVYYLLTFDRNPAFYTPEGMAFMKDVIVYLNNHGMKGLARTALESSELIQWELVDIRTLQNLFETLKKLKTELESPSTGLLEMLDSAITGISEQRCGDLARIASAPTSLARRPQLRRQKAVKGGQLVPRSGEPDQKKAKKQGLSPH